MEDIENSIPDNTTTNPNDRYNEFIYTITSTTDADNFCNKYNHANNYSGLSLGQRVRINDGEYNTIWLIAGFDCEYNHTASDGTIKDNGYGICLIPETELGFYYSWNSSPYTSAYMDSFAFSYHNSTVSTNLKRVLGSHLIKRNVLVSSSINSSTGKSDKYTWTDAYCTLMSGYQITGNAASYSNKYDDGEANYKLPIFNYIKYYGGGSNSDTIFLRGIYKTTNTRVSIYVYNSYNGKISHTVSSVTGSNCPMIYIR